MAKETSNENGHLTSTNVSKQVDDWDEWEDDNVITPIDAGEQVHIFQPPMSFQDQNTKSASARTSRLSTTKIRRLKSRQRQKAQNAKAGIKIITDMATLSRGNHERSPNMGAGKFVDAAALRALEGEPSSASVGNWNWLRRIYGKSPDTATPTQRNEAKNRDLSPEDRPIVIGISLPPSDMAGQQVHPHGACDGGQSSHPAATLGLRPRHARESLSYEAGGGSNAQKSMWSPDTPDTSPSLSPNRAVSSMYSQVTMHARFSKTQTPPPVPPVPSNYQEPAHKKRSSLGMGKKPQDEEGGDTPCTMFEEDVDISPQRSAKSNLLTLSPDSAGSRSHGWWDHVITPFADKSMSFSSRNQDLEPPKQQARNDTWRHLEGKETPAPWAKDLPLLAPSSPAQAPIVRAPMPRRSSSGGPDARAVGMPRPCSNGAVMVAEPSTGMATTPRIVVTPDSAIISDCPPPYSPREKREGGPIRYRAVFPPGHALNTQFPPTPRPASPGLAATMSSQRRAHGPIDDTPSTQRTQIPPTVREPLPVRAAGTYRPQEHAHPAPGRRYKVERKRRRHEKEDVIARRAGGFWRGRGCMPSTEEQPSIWVNLTDFPPMPTGVLTVVGPDNTVAKSGCTEPSTLWSCSLPKDQQAAVAPYKPNQPTLIMQIQWDNGTQRTWDVPNGDAPSSVARRAFGAAAHAGGVLLKRAQPAVTQFSPNPSPPSFKEMWFLGETTDNVKSSQKGGEPTPFYISLVKSVNDTASTSRLGRRESSPDIGNTTFKALIPPPDLEPDGTSAPAVMMPNPVQQPVRLYDRGLATEHYAFYTYFKRTIFLKSVSIQNQTDETMPLDQDGGCRKTEASHLVTWGETRLHVQIWTRALQNSSSTLLKPDDGSKGITGGGTGHLVRPGTMPYPVTITHDTHGGDPNKKLVWDRPINDRLQVQRDKAQALINDMGIGGTWINRRDSGDAKYGGFDGGTGGCKCEWVNWV
ncbi:uncharacterized protein UV8b_03908 [Ustilaginoidea virens]|uniref:Glycoprotease family protein n=1 Tax=Ustilaginoidea virens TaxID=1159556 RepID=A0A8E5MH74_USTVR|nr:uncharacterized protein UV8b_03908 [Ustilaginoidea virens]QUC19667.1 hypothetical protein UV8b_03908 [Ustilaginoidea virens]